MKLVIERPWKALCVNPIGPYMLKCKDGTLIDFMCLTMINPETGWFEMVELPTMIVEKHTEKIIKTSEIFDKTAKQTARLVNPSLFSRYSYPRFTIYDNGSKFKLSSQHLCDSYGIKRNPTRIKNPQENSILEHVHQIIMTMCCIAELDMHDTKLPEDVINFLAKTSWAICSNYHTALKASPGAAIFGRDMLFDILYIADWTKIRKHMQQ